MSIRHDPELDDILQDAELLHLAELLGSARRPEPPMDEAFRSALRRQLMQKAWEMGEGRPSWWHRFAAPPRLAWAGAAAGLVLIASVVVYMAMQPAGGFSQLVVNSPMDGAHAVRLEQPILVAFNQPMDHPSTEAAVQITPATTVTFSWQSNTLAVQPSSGDLAPNTQYQVTIGPGAKTAAGQLLASPQTITFVTQPPSTIPSPSPSPSPRPSPSAPLGEKQLAALAGSVRSAVQWSADSTAIYFVNAQGALELVPAKGGNVTVVAPDGVSSPSVAPAGDRLAYIRDGRIEVLTFAAGTTSELAVTPPPSAVGWAKDKLVWAAADGIYTPGASGPAQLAPLPANGNVSAVAIAPDGAHAVYQQEQNLWLLDLATARSVQLGQAGARFLVWSPSGTQLLYSAAAAIVVSDMQGGTVATIPSGEPSWSNQDAILLGSETDLYQVRPDGTALTKLADGTYRAPVWAPNGTAFAFFRGGALWSGSAPPLPPQPTALDQAAAVVNSFMQARLRGQPDQATAFLDDNGKQAYAPGGLNLTLGGDPFFSRFYVLTQEVTGTQPDTARFVVRLVLTHGKLDVSSFEETLTLQRDPAGRQFLIDQATAGAHRDLGKGAEVVGVEVAAGTLKVTFDSDLDPNSVSNGVIVLDSKGKQVGSSATYANRTVTVTGLDLKPGNPYRLVVLTTVRDVLGHNVASEYDLDLFGPAVKDRSGRQGSGPVPPPPPAASPEASPAPS
ncbi:hypothetical protein EPN29_05575 [bacterium]|nr:MAG: hypothetical protein EPN29_05575 [bacterium]